MNAFNAHDYGSVFASLLADAPVNELGPGRPATTMRKKLDDISLEAAFAPGKIADQTMAQACLAGLWLRFDFLDESHTISQAIHNPTGSFWHGILHRREPDYENAKYWFRRVGEHPAFAPLHAAAVGELAAGAKPSPLARGQGEGAANSAQGTLTPTLSQREREGEAAFLKSQAAWDPFRFVDLVATAAPSGSATEDLCRRIQQHEWELLFNHCYRAALAGG